MKPRPSEAMTVADAIAWATSVLERDDDLALRARADATLLLRHALGSSQAEIYAHPERPLTLSQVRTFQAHIEGRLQGRPIQYIVGEQEFFGLDFEVRPDVLIPRPETELLVEAAIERLGSLDSPRIADVGTGSGAIAVALAHALPRPRIVALDISPAALAVAERNAQRNGVAERIRFVESDLLAGLAGETFDAVVSNPPYVALDERYSLPLEVRDWEPETALFAGPKGTEFHARLASDARPILAPSGWLLMEIGQGQQRAVADILQHWNDVAFIDDLQGIPRVAAARKRSSPHSSDAAGSR
jgi:release factor glutamine methyltransferase